MKKILKQYRSTLILLAVIAVMTFINIDYGKSVVDSVWSNTLTMLGVLPAIFILIGLLDVWVPKETMIKYMGEGSGLKGLFFAFLLGSMAAGPLYAAFPVAAILLKKEARLAYVVFFLSTWTVAKIPLLLFEMTSLGVEFTVIHLATMLPIFLVGSFLIEKQISTEHKAQIVERVKLISE